MPIAQNKELVRRYFDERWNKNNLMVIDELLAPNLSAEDAKDLVAYLKGVFSDLRLTMDDSSRRGTKWWCRLR